MAPFHRGEHRIPLAFDNRTVCVELRLEAFILQDSFALGHIARYGNAHAYRHDTNVHDDIHAHSIPTIEACAVQRHRFAIGNNRDPVPRNNATAIEHWQSSTGNRALAIEHWQSSTGNGGTRLSGVHG